ncbi:MAG: hypothetical protein ABI650_11800, partial [Dokdonella sp.]
MQGIRIGWGVVMLSIALGLGCTVADAASVHTDEGSFASEQAREVNRKIVDTLSVEGTPRALILASMVQPFVDRESDDAIALIDRARALAPDDAFVQWFAAMRGTPADGSSDALHAMQRLEPGNGAVWIVALQRAS